MNTFSSRSRFLMPALQFIAQYIAAHQYAPSLREIMDAIGTPSLGHAKFVLDALAADGLVTLPEANGKRLARCILVTPHGRAVLNRQEVNA